MAISGSITFHWWELFFFHFSRSFSQWAWTSPPASSVLGSVLMQTFCMSCSECFLHSCFKSPVSDLVWGSPLWLSGFPHFFSIHHFWLHFFHLLEKAGRTWVSSCVYFITQATVWTTLKPCATTARARDFLVVQWVSLQASSAGVWVQSLARKLRS